MTRKKIIAITNGDTILPRNKPSLIHELVYGLRKFGLATVNAKKNNEAINGKTRTSP